jgi:hypothetical protein
MLRQTRQLNDYRLSARDGEIGRVREFFFDDKTWNIHYLIADTGDWFGGRRVLIPPDTLQPPVDSEKVIPIDLTKDQIRNSPALEAAARALQPCVLPHYPTVGVSTYPGLPDGKAGFSGRHRGDDVDSSLHTTADVARCKIAATDGQIGILTDLVIADQPWIIRYVIADTLNGRKSPISTRWIDHVDWDKGTIFARMPQEGILHSPQFPEHTFITRDHEEALHRYHGMSGYWEPERVCTD